MSEYGTSKNELHSWLAYETQVQVGALEGTRVKGRRRQILNRQALSYETAPRNLDFRVWRWFSTYYSNTMLERQLLMWQHIS